MSKFTQSSMTICYLLSLLLILAGCASIVYADPAVKSSAVWLVAIGAILAFATMLAPKMTALIWKGTRVDLQAEIASQIVDKIGPELRSIAETGTRWIDSKQAFKDATSRIDALATAARGGSLELRLLAISMSHSWAFVAGENPEYSLLDVVRKHKNIEFTLRMALMKHEYLSRFDLDERGNYSELSKTLPKRIADLKEKLKSNGLNNLSIETFYYEGFQQWHGLLVQGQELFLGRIDWDLQTESRKPRLLCGINDYRYFDQSTSDGRRRINQFRHWFTFYSDYDRLCTKSPKKSEPQNGASQST